jgi:carbonic anhydrase
MMRRSHLLLLTTVIATLHACTNQEPKQSTTIDSVPKAVVDTVKPSARPVHWTYDGDEGPKGWAALSPAYALCGTGTHQSPINIQKATVTGGVRWNFKYGNTSLRIAHNEHMDDIIDNGHTIQITVDEGSTFTFGEKSYVLKQFHFHTPVNIH